MVDVRITSSLAFRFPGFCTKMTMELVREIRLHTRWQSVFPCQGVFAVFEFASTQQVKTRRWWTRGQQTTIVEWGVWLVPALTMQHRQELSLTTPCNLSRTNPRKIQWEEKVKETTFHQLWSASRSTASTPSRFAQKREMTWRINSDVMQSTWCFVFFQAGHLRFACVVFHFQRTVIVRFA